MATLHAVGGQSDAWTGFTSSGGHPRAEQTNAQFGHRQPTDHLNCVRDSKTAPGNGPLCLATDGRSGRHRTRIVTEPQGLIFLVLISENQCSHLLFCFPSVACDCQVPAVTGRADQREGNSGVCHVVQSEMVSSLGKRSERGGTLFVTNLHSSNS